MPNNPGEKKDRARIPPLTHASALDARIILTPTQPSSAPPRGMSVTARRMVVAAPVESPSESSGTHLEKPQYRSQIAHAHVHARLADASTIAALRFIYRPILIGASVQITRRSIPAPCYTSSALWDRRTDGDSRTAAPVAPACPSRR